ncbi:MAG: methionine--tRNA ligase [Planctomycetes bacterium]|nr:methionine--tRNA ligase [Planctomycetota bacterium]
MSRVLVTSALPYANGPIHFGHIVGAYLPADIYVRFRRMLGDDVHYVCGTDEHGVAITLRAEQQGTGYAEYVDHWHGIIAKSLSDVGIEFDVFTGTAHHRNPYHRELAQQFFRDLDANGYLFERTEEQFYSESTGRFLPDRYVQGICYLCGYEKARGDECPSCGKYLEAKLLKEPRSTLDGSKPVLRATTHWYLDLAKIRDEWLGEWFESKRGTWKPNVENFVRSDLKDLRERPITRDLPWGVPVPVEGADGKVLYVWFDAPIGYMSISRQHWESVGAPERFEEFWRSPDTELYHFIGKDNITFHTVVFPSILWGSKRDWTLPSNVPANEFFNLEGRKFNTSTGWYIPEDALRGVVPVDALRYALCTMMPETADSEWTWDGFQSRVNDELADNLGNFVSRTLRFVEKFFDGVIPALGDLSDADRAALEAARQASQTMKECLGTFQFRRAGATLMGLGNVANRYYDAEQPWVTVKDDATRSRSGQSMRICVELIDALATLAAPIMPSTARTLRTAIGRDPEAFRFDRVGVVDDSDSHAGAPLSAALPKFTDPKGHEKTALFRKLSNEFIAEQKQRLEESAMESTTPPHEPLADSIDFDQFTAIDVRVGTVIAAEKHPKADRLLVVQVDLGFERRTVVAGIAASYAPEDLVGRRVNVVANLAPRKLRGVESQGMLLAADGADGKPRLLSADSDVPDGTRVR